MGLCPGGRIVWPGHHYQEFFDHHHHHHHQQHHQMYIIFVADTADNVCEAMSVKHFLHMTNLVCLMEQKCFTYQAILLHMTKCTFVWSTNLVCGATDKQDVCIIIVIPMITIIIIARRLMIYMSSPFLGDFF